MAKEYMRMIRGNLYDPGNIQYENKAEASGAAGISKGLTNEWENALALLGGISSEAQQKAGRTLAYADKLETEGLPYSAGLMRKELPDAFKLTSSREALQDLLGRLTKTGVEHLWTEPSTAVGRTAPDSGAAGSFNPWRNIIRVKPRMDKEELARTVLHELTHKLQYTPGIDTMMRESQQLYKQQKPTYQEDPEFAKKYPALTEYFTKYYEDPEEIQARRMAEKLMSLLYPGYKEKSDVTTLVSPLDKVHDRLLEDLMGSLGGVSGGDMSNVPLYQP